MFKELLLKTNLIRLDRFLSEMTSYSRKDLKMMIRQGRVRVGDQTALQPELKVDLQIDTVFLDGEPVIYEDLVYYMLNKPQGLVTATRDKREKTVLDLFSDEGKKDLFPVGRLDKDTEGLLLITNDGALAHFMLSPARHVAKVYHAVVKNPVSDEDILAFEKGLQVDEEWQALPAKLRLLSAEDHPICEVTIVEGKFHQVKRMFEAVGNEVLALKRVSMGPLDLDESLAPGAYRRLTDRELEDLFRLKPSKGKE